MGVGVMDDYKLMRFTRMCGKRKKEKKRKGKFAGEEGMPRFGAPDAAAKDVETLEIQVSTCNSGFYVYKKWMVGSRRYCCTLLLTTLVFAWAGLGRRHASSSTTGRAWSS